MVDQPPVGPQNSEPEQPNADAPAPQMPPTPEDVDRRPPATGYGGPSAESPAGGVTGGPSPGSSPPPAAQSGAPGQPPPTAVVGQFFAHEPPEPPKRSRINIVLAVLTIVFFLGMVLSWVALIIVSAGGGPEIFSTKPAVALIKVTGLIQSEGGASPFGPGGGTISVLDDLRKAAKDDEVKAIVLWIDSPGGSPAASEAVYSKIMEVKKKKPVVVAMGDVAASGGYYIACAATKIVACPSTETGSIGVIFSGFNIAGLMEKFGVKPQTITTGPYKDTGSPFREMRPDERKLLEGLLKDIYEQFVADVARGRNMPIEKVRKLADGRVYTGRQAKAVGLVDELGSRDDAIKLAAKLGGIEGWPRIKRYEKAPGLLPLLLGSGMAAPHRPWYVAVIERPGPWLTLPLPGAGFILYAGK